MKLSTRSRYGIRALLDLAMNSGDKPVSINDIARRQGISPRYLENIFHGLKTAGILGSSKGKGGGFYLSKSLKEISVLTIIDILDGELSIIDCIEHGKDCGRAGECYTRVMWEKLNKDIRNAFSDVNLEDVFGSIKK